MYCTTCSSEFYSLFALIIVGRKQISYLVYRYLFIYSKTPVFLVHHYIIRFWMRKFYSLICFFTNSHHERRYQMPALVGTYRLGAVGEEVNSFYYPFVREEWTAPVWALWWVNVILSCIWSWNNLPMIYWQLEFIPLMYLEFVFFNIPWRWNFYNLQALLEVNNSSIPIILYTGCLGWLTYYTLLRALYMVISREIHNFATLTVFLFFFTKI